MVAKMPAPTMAPIPNSVSCTGPSARRSLCSGSSASARMAPMGLVRRTLRRLEVGAEAAGSGVTLVAQFYDLSLQQTGEDEKGVLLRHGAELEDGAHVPLPVDPGEDEALAGVEVLAGEGEDVHLQDRHVVQGHGAQDAVLLARLGHGDEPLLGVLVQVVQGQHLLEGLVGGVPPALRDALAGGREQVVDAAD